MQITVFIYANDCRYSSAMLSFGYADIKISLNLRSPTCINALLFAFAYLIPFLTH